MKTIFAFLALLVCLSSCTGCHYAKSNQKVVVSEDCGMTWKAIKAGDAIPREGYNKCYMKVVMPNYPMQGTSNFHANFQGKVKVKATIDYDYSIVNELEFIRQAKYLGRANADADDDGALDPAAFETAENSVIDVRLREVAKGLFEDVDIVDADVSALEGRLDTAANKILETLGVHLNFVTLTIVPDEQTRQAIDVVTAMRIYQNAGIGAIGEKVIPAKAGAPRITLSAQNNDARKTEEE